MDDPSSGSNTSRKRPARIPPPEFGYGSSSSSDAMPATSRPTRSSSGSRRGGDVELHLLLALHVLGAGLAEVAAERALAAIDEIVLTARGDVR